ncbi:amino acid-binding protein [Methanobrevibacter sp. OttesenSCG-928-I08]|nr:amino acid-binding protein [Methanobrevibacter sp. OttesenSCG-928-I08]
MRMDLILELLDVPGQLVSVLEPIGGLGTNLVTVIHQRDMKNKRGMIPVQITLEGERNNLNKVIEKFKELNVSILEIDGIVQKENISTILIGHIVDKDIRDTTDKINELKGVYVNSFDIKLDGEDKSSALISIEADIGNKKLIFDRIKQIALEKDLLMINEV